jgi:S1-C subfamily serine protease
MTRMPLVAMGFAIIAVVIAGVAGIAVLMRDDAPAAVAGSATLIDQRVTAVDVMKLRDQVEIVVEAGQPRGLRVTDPAVAAALGLTGDDVVTAMMGRATTRDRDITEAMLHASTLRASTVFVEVDRSGQRIVLRWIVDGDLYEARRDALAAAADQLGIGMGTGSAVGGSVGGAGSGSGNLKQAWPFAAPSSGLKNPFDDTLLDTIEKVDDLNYRVPRATFEAMLASSQKTIKGARFVPSRKAGVLDGYKVFALTPTAALTKLGIANGDTLHSINTESLAELDDVRSFFVNARTRVQTYELALTRRGQPLTMRFQITK